MDTLPKLALIALAGSLGALSRYGLHNLINQAAGRPTLLGTLVVNVSGAFLLGLFLALTEQRYPLPASWRTVGAVGFLGAYTTFSTVMLESWRLIEDGAVVLGLANLVGSSVIGMVALVGGLMIGRALA